MSIGSLMSISPLLVSSNFYKDYQLKPSAIWHVRVMFKLAWLMSAVHTSIMQCSANHRIHDLRTLSESLIVSVISRLQAIVAPVARSISLVNSLVSLHREERGIE